ncbi:MAG: response regulator transcription factor [Lachnospiraceae bacterium]|nr:response regulator transcription factor [Lachnospiraceae bacterium]
MRILIIEDDKQLANEMKTGLERQGFTVDIANTGLDGEEKAYVTDYDTILLDLNLPDKDGLAILSFLRSNGRNMPVLIVSARDTVRERSTGLDLGADDYIVKPFDFVELTSRIRAVVRRFYGRTNPTIIIGSLSINPAIQTAVWGKEAIPLSSKEFDILLYLGERHPEIVSSEDIIEHTYNEDFDLFSSVLRVHISNLRKKLQAASGQNLLITIKGKGYCLWSNLEK